MKRYRRLGSAPRFNASSNWTPRPPRGPPVEEIVIACRPDDHNRSFVEQLQGRVAAERGLDGRLTCRYASELHEKGILSGKVLLSGSMNLTYNGIRRLEESILITDDTDAVARARHAYEDRWGGA